MEQIQVLVVDDYPVVREGLRTMLSTDQTIEVVGEASDGVEAVAIVAEKKPNVVLMGIHMPNINIDSIEATRRIKDKHPSTSVIVFTMYDEEAYVMDAIRAGASGYLLKDASRELLLHTVQAVSSGTTLIKTDLLYKAICPSITSKNGLQELGLPTSESLGTLTRREQEVLKMAVDGYTNKGTGKELGITEHTVKKHMKSILVKLGATNRTSAAVKATRAGLIK